MGEILNYNNWYTEVTASQTVVSIPPLIFYILTSGVTILTLGFLTWGINAGRNYARIIIMILLVPRIPALIAEFRSGFQLNAIGSIITLGQTAILLSVIWLVFSGEGSKWFKKRAI